MRAPGTAASGTLMDVMCSSDIPAREAATSCSSTILCTRRTSLVELMYTL
eukprot:CAMPEP_0114426436 /NCGR_PEP_ID=MMETSP0103-20121206/7799_1 /TAXON_ID=37642 ORGANISM="Paraphysomonas imperforata, Strain PA2" /NCGR_SAMPLE_ID=MMETSP0103 /ASSEMBLY_ACC=CAM_ASM_000201 /LENGTH=49 /DNA_ID=CAMNT_0001595401 /DNA_START=528 /DNA_END=677 /DNA_ORIENTATION=+